MAINSKEFICRLRNATIFCFKFTWARPITSILLCISVLICIFFPKVFKLLIFSAPLIVSTALFLAAILSVEPHPEKPESKTKEEKASVEGHGDEHGYAEFEIKRLAVVSEHEESNIRDCAGQTLVGEGTEIEETLHEEEGREQKTTENFADRLSISNAAGKRVEIMLPVKEEEDTTELLGLEEEEAINDSSSSHRGPLGLAIVETGEESVSAKQHTGSLGSNSDREEEGEVPPQNFFCLPLHSSWKRFDSSSDSGSEASLGSLGPMFDDIDPILFEENPNTLSNAQEEDASLDFRFSWIKDEGDEGLFELVHREGSDLLSEDENLIEIAVSEEQILERRGREMHEIYVQGQNRACIDNSNEETLRDQRSVKEPNVISEERAAFPEEENLIEIDLSVDTFAVAVPEESNPVEIRSSKGDESPAISKENLIHSSQLKIPTDLLNEPIHGRSPVLEDQTQLSESKQKNGIAEVKSIQEIESATKEVIAENLTCKHERTQDDSPFAPQQSTKTADLIDVGSLPPIEMPIAEEDEHSKPQKTEQPSDDLSTVYIAKIQHSNTTTS